MDNNGLSFFAILFLAFLALSAALGAHRLDVYLPGALGG